MAVYVDLPKWPWRGKMWCHLTADSVEELHAFARKLGLKESWYQYPKTPYPHYDTVFHKRALELGAVLVDSRVLVEKCKAIRPPNWVQERREYYRGRGGRKEG
jgi:hypothetical protein